MMLAKKGGVSPEQKLSVFWRQVKKHRLHLLMILPVIIWYAIFRYVPIYGVTLAFRNFRILDGIMGSPWVGWSHFERLFAGVSFWPVFTNTIMISFYGFIFGFPAPIILALLISELRFPRFKKITQTISYMPHFISWVVLSGIFISLLSPSRGPINGLLVMMGFDPIHFLASPQWFRTILVSTGVWRSVGWGSIIYLAALAGVDQGMYEAASMDGAGRLQRIWYITLPSIKPTIVIMLILTAGNIVDGDFDQIFNLLNPAVLSVGDVLDTYIFRAGISQMDFSYATAVSLFRNVISLVLVFGTNFIAKKTGEQALW